MMFLKLLIFGNNSLFLFLKQVNKKVQKANIKATNPFTASDFTYNPFMNAIEQTYIWVESKKWSN